MKSFVVFVVVFLAAQAVEESCYQNIVQACKRTSLRVQPIVQGCTSEYGAIDAVLGDLQSYVNTHITKSFEYLLMATHYATYEKNREGFEKLYRSFSDDKWNTAIELIKYINKRGGEMNFQVRKPEPNDTKNNFELYELESLARALDIEKRLGVEAHNIHSEATRKRNDHHDPQTSSYIEEEFLHKHSDNIRKLTGYIQDLLKIFDGPERNFGLHMFDEYLQKQ